MLVKDRCRRNLFSTRPAAFKKTLAMPLVRYPLLSAYAYDTGRGMLTSIENKTGSSVLSHYAYTMNNRGQRTQVSQSGNAFASASGYGWLYNGRGEVVAANHTADAAKNRAYNYDPIGNRLWSTEGNPAAGMPPESPDPLAAAIAEYTSNSLNQYTSVGAPFATPAVPTYDADGNMTDTGNGTTYTWDAENRLARVAKADGTEVHYAYDGESRRIKREVYKNNVLQTSTRYLYDGWNVIAEFESSTGILPVTPTRTYTWGLDLSGSFQGAGGVGGLLATRNPPLATSYAYTYDGNGNVSELIATDGTIAAHYEYDAFGKTLAKQGHQADANTYRFSTKPLDVESGLYYYGYRFYDPQLGRWPNRDPIGERGGRNLYAFVKNNGLSAIDYLGKDMKLYTKNIENIPIAFSDIIKETALLIHNWDVDPPLDYPAHVIGIRKTVSIKDVELKMSITFKTGTDLDEEVKDGYTVRTHEFKHAQDLKSAWNFTATEVNKYKGDYCSHPCAYIASCLANGYYKMQRSLYAVAQKRFDIDQYDGYASPESVENAKQDLVIIQQHLAEVVKSYSESLKKYEEKKCKKK